MALPLHAIGLVLRLPDESFVFELFLCGKLGERFRAGAQNLSQMWQRKLSATAQETWVTCPGGKPAQQLSFRCPATGSTEPTRVHSVDLCSRAGPFRAHPRPPPFQRIRRNKHENFRRPPTPWLMGDCSACRVACRNLSDLHGAAGRQEVDLLCDDRQSSAVAASVSRSCNGDLHSCIFTTNNFTICCRLWGNPRANRGRSPAQRLGLCPPGCEVRSYGPILAEAKALLLLLRLFESPAPPPPPGQSLLLHVGQAKLGRHGPAPASGSNVKAPGFLAPVEVQAEPRSGLTSCQKPCKTSKLAEQSLGLTGSALASGSAPRASNRACLLPGHGILCLL